MKAERKKHGCQREPLFCQLLLACEHPKGCKKSRPCSALGNLVITRRERSVMSRNLFPTTYLVLFVSSLPHELFRVG